MFSSIASYGAETVKIKLFEKGGTFVSDYDQVIEQIDNGRKNFTHLEFSRTIFPFRGRLGSGGTTLIVDIGKGKALRLARTSDLPMDFDDEAFRVDRDRLKDYLNTATSLDRDYGLPVPRVFTAESHQSANYLGELEYVVVEKMHPAYTLSEFLQSRYKFSEKECAESLKNLKQLAVAGHKIAGIRDLHPDNIAWDSVKKSWILMDFGREIYPYIPAATKSTHLLSSAGLPSAWQKIIDKAVAEERKAASNSNG